MSDYTKIKDKYTAYFDNFVYPNIIKSLFCRYMLVGEGVAERKIFELYLLKYGATLNKNDIDYCIVDGKIFFPCILQTLKDIGIKTITLHDLDAENQAIHQYLNEQIKLLSNKVISLKPDLENYLGITQEIKKQENYDKYRVATIMMNQYYLDDNLRLNELFDKISQMIEELNSEEKQGKQSLHFMLIYGIISSRSDTFLLQQYSHTNKLVRFYQGVDGLKTGYTGEAGYCLTSTMKRGNMRIITVVMNEPDSATRNSETVKMLDYAFGMYKVDTIVAQGKVVEKREIPSGDKVNIEISAKSDINVLRRKMDKDRDISYKTEVYDIKLPVNKGDVVGKIYLYEGSKKIGSGDLTVKDNVKKAGLFKVYIRNIGRVLSGKMGQNLNSSKYYYDFNGYMLYVNGKAVN